MHFYDRCLNRLDRVVQRDGSVGQGSSVQYDSLCPVSCCFLELVDEMTFMIALPDFNIQSNGAGLILHLAGNVIQRVGTIDFRLSHPE